jgi:2-C-methyl-D-erythritol 4-phosphate cytidylyltransferase
MKCYAIIPSGGSGSRTSHNLPKQYVKFAGKELIAYTLEVFQKCDEIDEIIIAAQPDYFDLLNEIKSKFSITKLVKVVEGGSERQHSVTNAINSINAANNDLICVHDAARPLLPQNVLLNAIKSAKIFDSIVVALAAKDTLINGGDMVHSYVDRKEFFYAQTPQIFKYSIITDAIKKAQNSSLIGTDESMLVKNASYDVKIIEGSSLNFKVTTDEDMALFKVLVESELR